MIKIYGMPTCPDCTYVEEQIKGNDRYQVIDIGAHVKNLKEFLRLRDSSPAFDGARRSGPASPASSSRTAPSPSSRKKPGSAPVPSPKAPPAGLMDPGADIFVNLLRCSIIEI